ncbi:MAG: glycosyltransferase family 4 protein [Nitrospiraceae bacterium]|nr:MAG: glycosyltransferase family 4 protein [Nitrospiraceae bacterium]
MNILIFTNLFPNPEQPLRGNFVANMVQEVSRLAVTSVVSPLPWFPGLNGRGTGPIRLNKEWGQFSRVPDFSRWNGLDVYYPKYPFIPVVSRAIQPSLIALSVSGVVNRLIEEKKIDVISGHWIYPDCVSAVKIGKKKGIPTVITARGCDINLYGGYRFRKPQIEWALQNAEKITAVSNALAERICRDFRISEKKVAVILNGVDRARFNYISESEKIKDNIGLERGKKYLLFIGQLHEVKGVHYLIEALHILSNRKKLFFETILIGSGPQRMEIEHSIKEKGLAGRVYLKGNKPNEEIPLWMNACDVLCLPSKREGMPNVVLEGLSCGLPVVASRTGGIPEVVNDNNGILVEAQNAPELANALETAFRKDWNREDISSGMEQFSWGKTAKSYLRIFEEVLRGR